MLGGRCLVYRAWDPPVFFSVYIPGGQFKFGGSPSESLRPAPGYREGLFPRIWVGQTPKPLLVNVRTRTRTCPRTPLITHQKQRTSPSQATCDFEKYGVSEAAGTSISPRIIVRLAFVSLTVEAASRMLVFRIAQ